MYCAEEYEADITLAVIFKACVVLLYRGWHNAQVDHQNKCKEIVLERNMLEHCVKSIAERINVPYSKVENAHKALTAVGYYRLCWELEQYQEKHAQKLTNADKDAKRSEYGELILGVIWNEWKLATVKEKAKYHNTKECQLIYKICMAKKKAKYVSLDSKTESQWQQYLQMIELYKKLQEQGVQPEYNTLMTKVNARDVYYKDWREGDIGTQLIPELPYNEQKIRPLRLDEK